MVDKFHVLEEDNKKRKLAEDNDYEQYEMTVNFTNDGEKPIKFLMISKERLSKFFLTIKMILPHREKFYLKFKIPIADDEEREIDETSDESEGFFGGVLCEHVSYLEAKQRNEDEKLISMQVTATFYPMKNLNIQVFANKILDENKYRAKGFFDNYLKENSLKILNYNITYNTTYFTISKDSHDILVIISDENFIDDLMKNDFENADKILFWTNMQKAKELLKKFPKKIMVCNTKFDFLLTPRYFKID